MRYTYYLDILTGSGASLPLTLTHILGGKLSSCSQLVSNRQNLQLKIRKNSMRFIYLLSKNQ